MHIEIEVGRFVCPRLKPKRLDLMVLSIDDLLTTLQYSLLVPGRTCILQKHCIYLSLN